MLPPTLDLRPDLLPIRNHIISRHCLPNTLCLIKEWQEYKKNTFREYFSSDFIHHHRCDKNISGMFLLDAMNISMTIGMLPEKKWNEKNINQETLDIARSYKFNCYNFLHEQEDIKNALYNNGPCYISLPVYNEKKLEFWKKESKKQVEKGFHSCAIVGWNSEAFIIRNMWDENWGLKGFTYLQFKDYQLSFKTVTIY